MGSRMACKSKLSAVERRVMKFSLQSLRTIGQAGWLFAFWSIAFLASWLHFFLYSAENWTTVPSYLRMDICCFSVFSMALVIQLVVRKSHWLTIMAAFFFYESAASLIIRLK